MNGDKDLFMLRRAGILPVGVWITDSDDDYARTTAREWLGRGTQPGGIKAAHLRLPADDIPAALDLRCLAGLDCHIASDRGPERFHRIFEAVKDAGARRVIGVSDGEVHFYQREEATHAG